MSPQFYTKHFEQKTTAVAKPGTLIEPGGLYYSLLPSNQHIWPKLFFWLFFCKPMFNTCCGSTINVTTSENKHIGGQRPRTQIQSLLLSTSLFSKQNNLNIGTSFRKHAAFELISGHFEDQTTSRNLCNLIGTSVFEKQTKKFRCSIIVIWWFFRNKGAKSIMDDNLGLLYSKRNAFQDVRQLWFVNHWKVLIRIYNTKSANLSVF